MKAKRSKSGTVSFDVLEIEATHCPAMVAALASALAKAQAELINPEKSLTEPAPLSSGLDIVRKTRPRHSFDVVDPLPWSPGSG